MTSAPWVSDPKTDTILIRVAAAERAMLRQRAKYFGVSVSEYVRSCAFQRPLTPRVDAEALGELRRQGGLIKHLATADRSHAYEYRVTLNLLQVTIRRLIRDRESS